MEVIGPSSRLTGRRPQSRPKSSLWYPNVAPGKSHRPVMKSAAAQTNASKPGAPLNLTNPAVISGRCHQRQTRLRTARRRKARLIRLQTPFLASSGDRLPHRWINNCICRILHTRFRRLISTSANPPLINQIVGSG